MEHAFLPASPRRWPLTLLVIALHLLLLAGLRWSLGKGQQPGAKEPARVTVRLLMPPPPLPSPPVPRPSPARRTPERLPPRRVEPLPMTAADRPAAPPITSTAEVPASLALPSPPAASGPAERLIDSAATRAAVRQAVREPLNGERHLEAQGQEVGVSASTKLGRQMQQAAYGDCAKGQYAGGGMGLLSAPFYLLAEATGKCAKGTPPPAGPPPPEPSGRKGAHASMRDR